MESDPSDVDPTSGTLARLLDVDQLTRVLRTVPSYVAVHRPILDDDGRLIDLVLAWWNPAYQQLFVNAPQFGQSMMETYYVPEIAVAHASEAWSTGHSHQFFSIDPDVLVRYLNFDRPTTLDVNWVRMGDLVVECGEDRTLLAETAAFLEQSDRELLEYSRETEALDLRRAIARDMHDSVIQRLLAVGLGIRQAMNDLDLSPDDLRTGEIVVANLDQAVLELRLIVNTLSRSDMSPDAHDLHKQLLDVTNTMQFALGHRTELTCRVECSPPEEVRHDVVAVVRESLANVVKHASATRTYVRCECDGVVLRVTVLDDGVGIDPDGGEGHGLSSLRERASLHGGRVSVKPRTDRSGTRVAWRIPCPETASPS